MSWLEQYESTTKTNSSILGIPLKTTFLNVCIRPTSIGGAREQSRRNQDMLNIVEKYSADTAVESEDGVVAIEYVVVAAAVVAGLLTIFGLFGTVLTDQLNTIIEGIG
jgi:Flp pilus assembly pilin Flp